MDRDTILSVIRDASESEKISAWNYYCSENCSDGEIFENDNDAYETMFSSMDEALRAAAYGNYTYTDQYCCLNGYGNLDTFQYIESDDSPYDEEALADWLEENPDEVPNLFDYDPEYYEDDEDKDDEDEDCEAAWYCPKCGARLDYGEYGYDSDKGVIVVRGCPECGCDGDEAVFVGDDGPEEP